MSIQLKISNSLDSLFAYLSHEISRSKTVFSPIYIVTQTEGMNSWLTLQIADHLGIAANLRFIRPNDFILEVYQRMGGTNKKAMTSKDFTWLLFEALQNENFIRRYPHVSRYYSPEVPDANIKRLALAQKVADLFDQYQIYRPEMIQKWNAEEEPTEWQAVLWKKVKAHAEDEFPDKDLIEKELLLHLKDPEKVISLQKEFPTVYFFGLSLITQYHYQIIQALSSTIDIEFLMQNPAPLDYWYEDKSAKLITYLKRKGIYREEEKAVANPLLVGWGKIIQDTFNLLFENDQVLNNLEHLGLIPPSEDTLLHHIQSTVFHNQKDDFHFSKRQLEDESVSIQSCYSPIREVEALYNYLVHLVKHNDHELSTRDIVVMVTDIDLYAPYIRAVFDEAPYPFRYTIADESYSVSDTLAHTLIALLSLTEENFTSEQVVSLLDFSALRKKFQIEDTEQIRKWVEAANIRFGIQGQKENDTNYVSWEYGLKRMMYGLCMSGGEEFGSGPDSFFPLDIAEGFDMMKVIRFVHFVEELIQSINQRRGKRSLSEWVEYVEQIIHTFIEDENAAESHEKNPLIKRLEHYNLLQDVLREKVSYDVFSYNFLPTLEQSRKSEYFGRGGITFCSLVPMRSIPFKVVALLGMDFDKFPRQDQQLSFDLMQREHRWGDRSLKDNDKHLFLETLLSAGDYLYMSYTGSSVKDNTPLMPSATIEELLDFIENHTDAEHQVREKLITYHPLHSFSQRYNTGNPRLYSYLLNIKQEKEDYHKEKEMPEFDFSEIDTQDLIRFLKDPFKGYFNRVLNIYYEEKELSLKETEVFTLNNLDKWLLNNRLLHIPTDEVADYQIQEVKQGRLPLKNMAAFAMSEALHTTAPVRQFYDKLTEGAQEETREIDLEIDDARLTGTLSNLFNNQLIHFSFSKREGKYLLSAYLQYLLLCAQGYSYALKFISLKEKRVKEGSILSKEEALSRLTSIVQLYKRGHRELLSYHCDFNINTKDLSKMNKHKFLKKIDKYFNNYKSPCTDPYQTKLFQNGFFNEESFDKYLEIAEILQIPLDDFFKEEKGT